MVVDDYGTPGRSEWRDVPWGEHLRWVEVDGQVLNVLDVGAGPPLLLVHGLSGTWQNFLENIPHFARSHRVIAPDLPGFGASPLPPGEVTIPGYGRLLDGLCTALDVHEPAAVVGNSMGGFIAAELALQVPERVERLVLISAAGVSSEHVKRDPTRTAARVAEYVGAWLAARNAWLIRRPRLNHRLLGFVFRHPERLAPELMWEQMLGSGKPGFLPALSAIMDWKIRDRLGEIACPTLIVWGRNDLVVPPRDAHVFHELIDDSRLVWFEDTGHLPHLERPARFNRLLEEFLAERPGHELPEEKVA